LQQDLFVEKIKVATQTIDKAEECIKTNYYGAKWMIQELLPLLQLSDSPRIVNVSSSGGKLEVFYLSAYQSYNTSYHKHLFLIQ